MKQLILIATFLFSVAGISQQVLVRTNTATGTNKSWQAYRQNSPTNVYGNSFVLFEVNYDSIYMRSPFVKVDILDNRKGFLPSVKYLSADNFGNISQKSFDSLMFPVSQITNLNTLLMDRPTLADGMLLYKPASYAPTYTDVITGLGYVPYNGTTNPNGYVTSNNVYTAGTGLLQSGSTPSVTFSIDPNYTMTVTRAGDSIAMINTRVNGKVSSGRLITINGTTFDLSADRTWSNVGIELPSQTSQSGKYLTTNGTSVSWQTLPSSTFTIGGAASRSLNSNFTISSTKQSFVSYSVTCSVTNPLIVGTSTANAFLEYSTNGGSSWVTVAQQSNSSGVGVTVTVQLTNAQTGVLSGYIPANALVRLRSTTTGTGTVTYVTGQETIF